MFHNFSLKTVIFLRLNLVSTFESNGLIVLTIQNSFEQKYRQIDKKSLENSTTSFESRKISQNISFKSSKNLMKFRIQNYSSYDFNLEKRSKGDQRSKSFVKPFGSKFQAVSGVFQLLID